MNKILAQGKAIFGQAENVRLDLFLAERLPEVSRTIIQRSIEEGSVSVNSVKRKSRYKLQKGDEITYVIHDTEVDISQIPAENIPLDIIFENDDVLVINKQAGLTSHPTNNQITGTLVNALLHHYAQIKDAVFDPLSNKSQIRAGIVHRLDKDTTGVMIVAKNSCSLRSLSLQIQHRDVTKSYLGLCWGWISPEKDTISNYLGRDKNNRKLFTATDETRGKKAITNYEVLSYYHDIKGNKYSFVKFELLTGRTHQIRSHCFSIGHPLIGDELYFSAASKTCSDYLGAKRQLLHSSELTIKLPGEDKPRIFSAPLPKDFADALKKLNHEN